ncbi:ABC transporter substrate-binding protein, partial [Rhodococcus koreensis]|uniref:ABC transporter substrate-binding protein n=1 Tax=Rhodococcus koreensis TaxID=99653 RepID=UPI001474F5FC
PEEAAAAGAPSTAPLKIGTLLPDTGSLSFLGPPMVAGTQLGVNDVNAAGGVLGQPVQLIPGDSGDSTTDTANTTVDRELAAGTQVIIGAASSSVSLKVIDKVSSAGVVMFSPANTSDQFVCYPDKGQYFRTAPTDVLQAQAVSQLISDDGGQRVSILALNDPYGTGLADNIQKNLVDAGIPEDQIQKIIYDPNAQSFNSEVDQVKDFAPDAVAVV